MYYSIHYAVPYCTELYYAMLNYTLLWYIILCIILYYVQQF